MAVHIVDKDQYRSVDVKCIYNRKSEDTLASLRHSGCNLVGGPSLQGCGFWLIA